MSHLRRASIHKDVIAIDNLDVIAINKQCPLIAFLLTPKQVTLNDPEWPFGVKFCFVPVCFEL